MLSHRERVTGCAGRDTDDLETFHLRSSVCFPALNPCQLWSHGDVMLSPGSIHLKARCGGAQVCANSPNNLSSSFPPVPEAPKAQTWTALAAEPERAAPWSCFPLPRCRPWGEASSAAMLNHYCVSGVQLSHSGKDRELCVL